MLARPSSSRRAFSTFLLRPGGSFGRNSRSLHSHGRALVADFVIELLFSGGRALVLAVVHATEAPTWTCTIRPRSLVLWLVLVVFGGLAAVMCLGGVGGAVAQDARVPPNH